MKKIKKIIKDRLMSQETKENTERIHRLEHKARKAENRLIQLGRSIEDIRAELEDEEMLLPGFERDEGTVSKKIEMLLENELVLIIIASAAVGIVASSLVWFYSNVL